MAKKGPEYINCNERQTSCTKRSAQPRVGCPTCEFTIQHKHFLEETEKELANLKRSSREGARDWPLKMLIPFVIEMGSIANSQEGTNPKWPLGIATFVAVYRGEMGKMKTIENHNLTAGMETDPAKPKKTFGKVPKILTDPDEDSGVYD